MFSCDAPSVNSRPHLFINIEVRDFALTLNVDQGEAKTTRRAANYSSTMCLNQKRCAVDDRIVPSMEGSG